MIYKRKCRIGLIVDNKKFVNDLEKRHANLN